MKTNWFYTLIALMFVSMLMVSARYFKGSGHSSVGVTDAKDHKITTEKSAFVKSIAVVPGQEVKKGTLLIELTSAELEMDIDRITNRIAALKSELEEKTKLIQAAIASIRAEQGIEVGKINMDLLETESEFQMNRKLTSQVAGNSVIDSEVHPLQQKIQSLKQQQQRHEVAAGLHIKDVLQKGEAEQRLLETQISMQQRELDLLQDQRQKLNKYATANGVIESVYVKPGEQVAAYTALLSVNPLHPTTIVGYLIGRKEEFSIGQQVEVLSYERKSNHVAGRVIGYGSVVQLPEILQKSTAVKAFGREVFIEIAPQNTFATGEKVLIR